jgi:uncharacterized protein (DUF924 family)
MRQQREDTMPATTPPPAPGGVVDFWMTEVGPKGWYAGGAELDDTIRARFLTLWESARAGKLSRWLGSPEGLFAFILLTDQFPRNMFRGDGRSFATDALARKATSKAVHEAWDLRIPEPERQFIYLPLMHSENSTDQNRCVRLMISRMPETGADNLLHARAHRAVIRQFGRFPYRNDALGRDTTPAEAEYLAAGGYGSTVTALREAA